MGFGDLVPVTHLGRLITVFACIAGVVGLALVVTALTNTTDFSQKEDLVYDAIMSDSEVQNQLKTDAAVVIKDFLTLIRLKKRQLESKRRTQLLMGLITHVHRFHTKRL